MTYIRVRYETGWTFFPRVRSAFLFSPSYLGHGAVLWDFTWSFYLIYFYGSIGFKNEVGGQEEPDVVKEAIKGIAGCRQFSIRSKGALYTCRVYIYNTYTYTCVAKSTYLRNGYDGGSFFTTAI